MESGAGDPLGVFHIFMVDGGGVRNNRDKDKDGESCAKAPGSQGI